VKQKFISDTNYTHFSYVDNATDCENKET